MVLPRARKKRSLAKFLATLCAVNALFLTLPVCSAEQQRAGDGQEHRALGAQLFLENADGSPVTWSSTENGNGQVQITSVISVTSSEDPTPVYGTDLDQPTPLPPLDEETQSPIVVFTSPMYVETHEPDTPEPIVLMDTYPPEEGDGDGEPADEVTPVPCTDEPGVSDSSEPWDPSPATETPTIPPADESPITVTFPDPEPTPAPASDDTEPAVVVVYTPSTADDSVPGAEEPLDGVTDTPEPADTLDVDEDPAPFDEDDGSEWPVMTLAPFDEDGGEGGEGGASEPTIIIEIEPPFPDPPTVIENEPPAPGTDVSPHMFATKTAYWDQRNLFVNDPQALLVAEKMEQERQELTLLQVQQVNRHGTRFPMKSNMEEIISLIEKLQTKYADFIPAWLQDYSLPYNVSIEGTLASAGVVELQQFGARTRETIGSLLPTEFAKEQFVFQHTYKSRTKDSATSFASTFFTNPEDVEYIEYSKKQDRFLRFFDECPRYVTEVKDNAEAHSEVAAFKESSQVILQVEYLKSRLNLPIDADLTVLDLESAYSACGFDIALYGTYSNWCTLLTSDLVAILDYAEDLENFYEKGGGYPINYEIAAVLLKDIVGHMKKLIAGTTQVVGNFRFAHAETTLPLMTLLGYGDRTPLLSAFSREQIAFRGFWTSALSPLAANIDFRLYQSKQSGDRGENKYFVQVLVNERVAPVPGCDDRVFCELSKIEELWGHYLNEYDFDADCKVN